MGAEPTRGQALLPHDSTARGYPYRLIALAGGAVVLTLALVGCSEGSRPLPDPQIATVIGVGATHPTVAIDPTSGRGYVAWVGEGEYGFDVFVASAPAGEGTFGPPVRVNDLPGDAAPHEQAPAQVATGPGGEIYVLWQNNTVVEGRRFPASDLRFAASSNGGHTFTSTRTVNDDAGGLPSSHTFHDMVVAPDGTIVVSWIDSRDPDRAAAAAAAGKPLSSLADTTSDIRVAISGDGGKSFSPGIIVDENPCPCCRVSVAVGADGMVYVAWRKLFAGDVRDVVVARAKLPGLLFEKPVRVHEDGWIFPGCPHAGASIAVDDANRLHVAWYTGREDRQGLWYTSSDDGAATFAEPFAVQTGAWVPPSLASLVPFGEGVLASWDDRREETPLVRLSFLNPRGRISSLEGSSAVGQAPSIATDGERALVAWVLGDAIHARWVAKRN